MKCRIVLGEALEELRKLESGSVHCCVTSPPYWGLRNYKAENQYGLEPTMKEYVERLVIVCREIHRVLRDDGTFWLNLGDTYMTGAGKGSRGKHTGKQTCSVAQQPAQQPNRLSKELPPKALCLIPSRVAIALEDDGWICRNEIIWAKLNPTPESIKDRCTKSHEKIWFFVKSQKYHFDAEAVAEPCAESSYVRLAQDIEKQTGSDRIPEKTNGNMKAALPRYGGKKYTETPDVFFRTKSGNMYEPKMYRNRRDVWHVPTASFSGAHFATYPEALIEPCVLAGCPEGGIVLDPFLGSGTTAVVALRHRRRTIGIDINPDHIKIAQERALSGNLQPFLLD